MTTKTTDKQISLVLDAVAQIVKDEQTARQAADAEVKADVSATVQQVMERLNGLDGNLLVKTASVAIADANLAAIKEHAENVLLRRSKHLSGTLPAIAVGVDQ
jgi:hypothetical protein